MEVLPIQSSGFLNMKILSPVDNLEEVDTIIDAGADELYCGVLTSDWHNRYIGGAINRRPGGGSNFTSFNELKGCVKIAHAKNVPVYLTLNEHYYTFEQYPFIYEFLNRAMETGIDAFIVADLAILLTLRERYPDVRVIISTGGNTLNSETVGFYQELGASRIILSRHLTIGEIIDIRSQAKDIELEVFILNSRCPNIDGLCTFHHGLADRSLSLLYQNACCLPYEISAITRKGDQPKNISWERQHVWEMVHIDDYPCGACALYEFDEIGITSVKIVGRGNSTVRKMADLNFLRGLMNILEHEKPSKVTFRRLAQKKYGDIYQRPCRIYMCYYPEVLTK